ncbi:hypothetical protein [Streptomyces sp. MNP-20]|uniref:hypothetical protein n=1 Tax=Streptomyces sp. MNP-20 TaxID=2721165 RepID=UPI0015548C88|nr:hypothetical protein [Streptomyces sp. MNP-20]
MNVVEKNLASKSGPLDTCEDGIVVTPHHAAVIDGATDKSGARFDGVLGGQFAMQVCVEVIEGLTPDIDALTAIQQMTEALHMRLPGKLVIEDRPSASVAVYSMSRREIWRLGDVSIWCDGMPRGGNRPQKLVDFHAAGVRAAILSAELTNGRTIDELRHEDCGRSAIMPLLMQQGAFANNPEAGEWSYGVINGNPVPASFVERFPVLDGSHSVVLASDGYPLALPTLEEAEKHLQSLLDIDSLCIGPLRGTKGVQPGAESYDDRAYLRLAI